MIAWCKMKYLTLLLLVACNKNSLNLQPVIYSEAINAEVLRFEETFDTDVSIEVVYVDKFSAVVDSNQVAICIPNRRIEIKNGTKGKLLTYLVFHELGHCVLGLNHWDEELDIMNTFVVFPPSNMALAIEKMFLNYERGIYEN